MKARCVYASEFLSLTAKLHQIEIWRNYVFGCNTKAAAIKLRHNLFFITIQTKCKISGLIMKLNHLNLLTSFNVIN